MEFVCAEDGSPSTAIELLDVGISDYLRQNMPAMSTAAAAAQQSADLADAAGDFGDFEGGGLGDGTTGGFTGTSTGGGGGGSSSNGGSGASASGSSTGSTLNGISKEGIDAFVSSMAGYAVITYLLGVGDRHLGNLLLLPNGRLCHIDFGYVFGDDPKKKFVNPPPFRITKGMVDAMGGQKSSPFQQFCRKALEAYKELRYNAVLIMSLLRLMKDTGIEALVVNADAKLQVSSAVLITGQSMPPEK
jgi:hypothetical protein